MIRIQRWKGGGRDINRKFQFPADGRDTPNDIGTVNSSTVLGVSCNNTGFYKIPKGFAISDDNSHGLIETPMNLFD